MFRPNGRNGYIIECDGECGAVNHTGQTSFFTKPEMLYGGRLGAPPNSRSLAKLSQAVRSGRTLALKRQASTSSEKYQANSS